MADRVGLSEKYSDFKFVVKNAGLIWSPFFQSELHLRGVF